MRFVDDEIHALLPFPLFLQVVWRTDSNLDYAPDRRLLNRIQNNTVCCGCQCYSEGDGDGDDHSSNKIL